MDSVDKFKAEFGYWAEIPDHPIEDWRTETQNDDTRAGYHDWARGRIEEANNKNEDGSYG